MKKIFLIIAFIFAVIAVSNTESIAEVSPSLEIKVLYNDSISNSMKREVTLTLDPNRIPDSVRIVTYYKGEIDIDRLILIRGMITDFKGVQTLNYYSTAAGDTTTLTVNLDSAVTTLERSLLISNFYGANTFKLIYEAASSGNDAADINKLYSIALIYYRD